MANYKRKLIPPDQIKRRHVVADPERGLPALTPKEEAFVMGLLQGKTAVDAYRAAYDVADVSQPSVTVQACTVRAKPKIEQALRWYQRSGQDAGKITVEAHLAELTRLRELAVEATQIAAGVQAEVSRGKASGLYEDRLRLQIGPPDDVLLGQLASILGNDLASNLKQALIEDAEFEDVVPDGTV